LSKNQTDNSAYQLMPVTGSTIYNQLNWRYAVEEEKYLKTSTNSLFTKFSINPLRVAQINIFPIMHQSNNPFIQSLSHFISEFSNCFLPFPD